jgi:hypothetical protein
MTQPLTPCIVIGTYVEVIGLDIRGIVCDIQIDSNYQPIYTVELDNCTDTPNGLYIARVFELRAL